ncbi:FAD/NAD(P)-binding protein [Allosphingosinicella sp.]|jgi:uncharacterized NAD(P)/FAD-binding protein YdhS|uniref:FAD/NAD(P)-binding protein n=1 Tax=Allosphingosinicella sp. TaxID=2823234 RepID=UPI002F0AD5BF
MRVAIVGGGYSGTIAAAAFARRGAEVTLVEKAERFAAGAAYSTSEPSHLLNVRARSMSALDEAPRHFRDWVEREGLGGGDTFVPRRDYRRYLAGIWEEALATGRVRALHGVAVAAAEGRLELADGTRIGLDRLVLAGGNYPSRLPLGLGVPPSRAVDDPWGPQGSERLRALAAQAGDLLLVGTGLTMVDVCLTLDEAGFTGRMIATSRRGLVPRRHVEAGDEPLPSPGPLPLRSLVREVRGTARRAPWRAAVDALRADSVAIWRGWSEPERRRFLRHLRPWWDVHRHRIAPPVASRIETMRREQRLEVIAGRISFAEEGAGGLGVSIRRRGGGEERVQVSAVVNCTGPEGDLSRVEDPLVRQLIASGQARPDPLRIGLDVDAQSRVLSSAGWASETLYALGPLTRGAFWEMVAVPDIRGQIERVAAAAY